MVSKLADIPELHEKEGEELTKQDSITEEDQEAQKEKEEKEEEFYTALLKITKNKEDHDVDTADFKFLTDFALCNITLTVYRELQNNSFFTQTKDPEVDSPAAEEESQEEQERNESLRRLQAYTTKGKFRLCQLYPLILRATIGYYQTIAVNYYQDTIEARRYDQVPIGLNDKAYAIVCSAIRKLVEREMEREGENIDLESND